jgi:hypothetical protein
MTGDEKVAVAVNRARGTWLMMMVASGLIIGVLFPPFYLIFLLPLGGILYFATLMVTVAYLQQTLTVADFPEDHEAMLKEVQEEIARRESLDSEPSEALMQALAHSAGVKVAHVTAASEPIGTYDGKPMHEWVELMDLLSKEVLRFEYYSTAHVSNDGIVMMPFESGKMFAHVESCIYVREIALT